MEKPFSAYTGTDDYIFVCYAHRDAETVYADIVKLNHDGVNIWYDEGIPAGTSWRGEIANAIKCASKFIYFISDASLKSNHCLREVDYALSNDVDILPVYLEDADLPPELDLVLNRVQAIYRHRDPKYLKRLLLALESSTSFIPRASSSKRKLRNWTLPILVISLVLGYRFLVTGDNFRLDDASQAPTTSMQPAAFDLYLEGLDLMARWDKDDNLEKAMQLFDEAKTIDPDFALAYARLAEASRMQYALTRDSAWLDKAINDIDEAVRLNEDLAPVQVVLGRIQNTRGNFDLATAALERALAIDPNDVLANQSVASLYQRLGRQDDAETYFLKATTLDPDDLSARNAYANFLFDNDRLEEAAAEWQAIIRLAPDNYAALINLGSTLHQIGRIPEAITMFQRAIELQPTYMAYSNLGTVYGMARRFDDAVDAYTQALAIEESDWLAWGNLAFIYSWMDDRQDVARQTFEQAIRIAEEARQTSPRDPYIFGDLSLYYAKTGQQDLSIQRLQTALALAPESRDIRYAVAEAYEILGQRENALENLQQAMALGLPRYRIQQNPELTELLEDPQFRQ